MYQIDDIGDQYDAKFAHGRSDELHTAHGDFSGCKIFGDYSGATR
jgi:hypothetical protein